MPNGPKENAARLVKGDQIKNQSHHHAGMVELKTQLGDARPGGRTEGGKPKWTLSLINPDSPSCYWGYHTKTRNPYRLSTDPADYAWETWLDNIRRRDSTAQSEAAKAAMTPEQHIAKGRKGAHIRWHVKLDMVKPDCLYCVRDKLDHR